MMRKIIEFTLALVLTLSASATHVLAEESELDGLWLHAMELLDDSQEKEQRTTLTRLEFIKEVFGHIVLGQDEAVNIEFPDVEEHDAPIVSAAVRAGIANGHDDGTFRPDAVITVEQAVSMVIKFLDLSDHALALPNELLEESDIYYIPLWVTPYVKWAMTYSHELLRHFEIGAPAYSELVEVLKNIIQAHSPAAPEPAEPELPELPELWLSAVELMDDSQEEVRRTISRLDFIKEVFGTIVMNQDEAIDIVFPDIEEHDAAIVAAAVRAGIANGHDDGLFRPDEIITVEQAVAMVIKHLDLRDHALALPDELLEGEDIPFWITPYLKWAIVYSEDLLQLFEIGAPATPELIDVLKNIILVYKQPVWITSE